MAALDRESLIQDMTAWRRDLHRHPEFGFEEKRTSAFVAQKLREFGLDEVVEGVGGTGVVGTLRRGSGNRAVALRADMDALRITEQGNHDHISQTSGVMHACGHDGHTSMLLGAAKLLANDGGFDGTVRFVFQPAEEHGRGAAAMLADGLLQRFPIDEIYGVHNLPGLPAGHFATRAGALMASEDNFVITITGRGGHAARPQMAIDPLVIGAETVLALQTIVARSLDPRHAAVLSCTEFITDGIRNAIPSQVVIKGDTRSDTPEVQALLQSRLRELCDGICRAHGATCTVEYTHEFAPTVNWPQCVAVAVRAAQAVAGAERVDGEAPPLMISEDFGRFLQHLPGAFVFIGNGVGDFGSDDPGGVPLHNARYDFNDRIVPIGARWFAELVRQRLPRAPAA